MTYSAADVKELLEKDISADFRILTREETRHAASMMSHYDLSDTQIMSIESDELPFDSMDIYICPDDTKSKELLLIKKTGLYAINDKGENAYWGESLCCDAFDHTFLSREANLVIEIHLVEWAGLSPEEERVTVHQEYISARNRLNILILSIMRVLENGTA